MTDRWQPSRAGIINVWRYYDEIFSFYQGRLLLRGPNGTGKSKALELLLPYLFDANLRPHRLSTFGSADRTMHWNLMGEGNQGSTRVGYVWLEFQHGEEWFTCGARLQATTNTTNVSATYFTTSLRVGDLALVNEAGRPLTTTDLTAAIGEHGVVHTSPADYRHTVRTTLFPGVTEQRYDSLITALLQLRTPKLSERLDPSVLSSLLSKALPPLDQSDLTEIAEGFERLDRQREGLRRLDEEITTAERLAGVQRVYAQRVLGSAAWALETATEQLDELTRAARMSDRRYERQITLTDEAFDQLAALGREARAVDAEISGISDLPAYQEGRQLDQLRQQLSAASQRAAEAAAHAAKLRARAVADEELAGQAKSEAAARADELRRSVVLAREAAEQAGMPSVLEEIESGADAKAGRQLLTAAVEARSAEINSITRAVTAHKRAVDARNAARQRLEETRDELELATEAETAAQRTFEQAFAKFCADVDTWARGCSELNVSEHHEVVEAAALAREEFSRIEARLDETRTALNGQLSQYRSIREKLANQVDVPPPAPYTRDDDFRVSAAGAPLWRLVDFRPGTPPSVCAAVEAALEASGLLDAWLTPDASFDLTARDRFAEPLLSGPAPGTTLLEVLVTDDERCHRFLDGVAFGETASGHTTAIGADGTWRLGNAHGRWTKPAPTYIGADARKRARAGRIAELTGLIEQLATDLSGVDAARNQIAVRRATLAGEMARKPSTDPMDVAEEQRTKAQLRSAARKDAVAADQLRVTETEAAVARLGQVAEVPDADELTAFGTAAHRWLDDRRDALTAEALSVEAGSRASASSALADEAEETASARQQEASDLAVTLETVERAASSEFHALDQRLITLRAKALELAEQRELLQDKQTGLARTLGTLEEKRRTDTSRAAEATFAHEAAETRYRHLTSGHLPADAGEVPDGPVDPRLIRDSESRLGMAVHEAQQQLAGRIELSLDPDDDVTVLTATLDGTRMGAHALLQTLQAERDRMRTHITDVERDLFDQTLTGDTRRHIAQRIQGASELVATMNHRLERVQTASGIRVQLDWQVDPQLPPGTREARDLLLRSDLNDHERALLHDFFRERVEEARAHDSATGWEQQLAQVLDYTTWHQFVVKVDRGEGWVPVTKRVHGALSGGEKAIVLHLPLFAAAAAHYHATPTAPRLILLDEVFVGVDATNRGQLLELLVNFDLDLVLTSDHEWCDYRELTGIAIHQLTTGTDGDDAVTTVRFTWDGHSLTADED
ncbi:SbcC/MukB-like Walker B domain-containing protein [Lentzea sp. HUAS12]|uniref:SbcC/MukB-like Walker B domain-containing protein n=1 Tax=Lentzea sp. HUAS12 TaxID=2951806 RepID=UPI00209F9EFA|nr:SbcC/MukB-like Walker B domain-containing protein [Lentzea sp. HUAS12]USX48771.1 TIGR02680 family protein [Lentzea sp. HUAS12]